MKPTNDETAAGAETPAPAETETASAVDLARITDELARQKGRVLELTAELDNQAKRFVRERQVVRDEITRRFAREIILVADNLDLALGNDPNKVDAIALAQGVHLTREVLLQTLRDFGVEKVPTIGTRFDPAFHEAIGEEAREGVASGTILHELSSGFRLGAQLVRAAKVLVAKSPTAQTEA